MWSAKRKLPEPSIASRARSLMRRRAYSGRRWNFRSAASRRGMDCDRRVRLTSGIAIDEMGHVQRPPAAVEAVLFHEGESEPLDPEGDTSGFGGGPVRQCDVHPLAEEIAMDVDRSQRQRRSPWTTEAELRFEPGDLLQQPPAAPFAEEKRIAGRLNLRRQSGTPENLPGRGGDPPQAAPDIAIASDRDDLAHGEALEPRVPGDMPRSLGSETDPARGHDQRRLLQPLSFEQIVKVIADRWREDLTRHGAGRIRHPRRVFRKRFEEAELAE